MVSLSAVLIGLEVLAAYVPILVIDTNEILWTVLTVPAVTIGMTLSVWKRGQLSEWWAYEERYVGRGT